MSNKFKQGAHYCATPILGKKEGKVWVCECGSRYQCKRVKGRLAWLQIGDGRWK